MLTPNPNECNSTPTSVTGGTYPYPNNFEANLFHDTGCLLIQVIVMT